MCTVIIRYKKPKCVVIALEAIIQLIGPGGNGKGLFEKMLEKLCTMDRVAALTLT